MVNVCKGYSTPYLYPAFPNTSIPVVPDVWATTAPVSAGMRAATSPMALSLTQMMMKSASVRSESSVWGSTMAVSALSSLRPNACLRCSATFPLPAMSIFILSVLSILRKNILEISGQPFHSHGSPEIDFDARVDCSAIGDKHVDAERSAV